MGKGSWDERSGEEEQRIKKRIKVYLVHVSTAQKQCDYYVLQTLLVEKTKNKREGPYLGELWIFETSSPCVAFIGSTRKSLLKHQMTPIFISWLKDKSA